MAEPVFDPPLIKPLPSRPGEADLPFEDGEPLAESARQFNPLKHAFDALCGHTRHRADVAVQADMTIHYETMDDNGEPVRRQVAPDVFVAFGAPKRLRNSFVLWDEPSGPDFVLEVLSPGTWKRDVGEKKEIYAALDVAEYWMMDPYGDYLDAPLIGYRLGDDGSYQPIEPCSLGVYPSAVLGLELRVEDGLLRFRDPRSGEDLKTYEELHDAGRSTAAALETAAAELENAAARLEREQAERAAALRRIAELEAEWRQRRDRGP